MHHYADRTFGGLENRALTWAVLRVPGLNWSFNQSDRDSVPDARMKQQYMQPTDGALQMGCRLTKSGWFELECK